jgi:hypothetical protein
VTHVHVHLDGREVAQSTLRHTPDILASLGVR